MGRNIYGDINLKLWFGLQDSNAADRFGVEGVYPSELYYYFDEDNLPDIYEELSKIEDGLGNKLGKLRKFFEGNPSYNEEMVAEYLNIPLNSVNSILQNYADYELGLKIVKSIQDTGQCEFTAEC